ETAAPTVAGADADALALRRRVSAVPSKRSALSSGRGRCCGVGVGEFVRGCVLGGCAFGGYQRFLRALAFVALSLRLLARPLRRRLRVPRGHLASLGDVGLPGRRVRRPGGRPSSVSTPTRA